MCFRVLPLFRLPILTEDLAFEMDPADQSAFHGLADTLGKQGALLGRHESALAAIGDSLESFNAGLTDLVTQVQQVFSVRPASVTPCSEPRLPPPPKIS